MADTKRIATTRPESRRGMSRGQIREERRERSRGRARRKRMLLMFGGITFALVFISALVLSPNLTPRSSSLQGLNTGGFVELDVSEGGNHIAGNRPNTLGYLVVPATSGPHWAALNTPAGVSAPAPWGRYDQILPDEVLVHNLEHGGVGIHYDCDNDCAELVQQLDDIIPRNPSQFIMSPYPRLPKKIAITAWRHHLYLDEFDEDLIRQFIDEYQDRAPESIR